MNIFGVIIGQHLLMLLMAGFLISVGFGMISMGWWISIPGIAIFAGSVGWAVDILLYRNAHIAQLGLPPNMLATVLAAVFACIYVFQKRKEPSRKFSPGKRPELDRNTVIASIVLAVGLLTAWVYLSQGNWDSFLHFDDQAADRAFDRTHNGALRFVNKFLAAVNKALAR